MKSHNQSTQKLFAIHLLNDFSGSPLVFKQALNTLSSQYQIHLYTSNTEGFLSNIENIQTHPFTYKWSKNKFKTLWNFLQVQWILSLRILLHVKANDIVYINTLLPAFIALAAKCKRCKVVFHVHETSIKPLALMKLLVYIANYTADSFLFVSNYVSEQFRFPTLKKIVIYNTLPNSFIKEALQSNKSKQQQFTISMLCSLKKYKGIFEFIELAKLLPDCSFILVLNCSSEDAKQFIAQNQIPSNCEVLSAIKNTIPIYAKSDLIVNLSRPTEWVETFGMTILEAMYFGIPTIVPPVGGVCELIDHQLNGYCIHGEDFKLLTATINDLKNNTSLYNQLAEKARLKALEFNNSFFEHTLQSCFNKLYSF